eukprot:5425344-Alexandrium_andersonii.AAC.1
MQRAARLAAPFSARGKQYWSSSLSGTERQAGAGASPRTTPGPAKETWGQRPRDPGRDRGCARHDLPEDLQGHQ